MEDNNKSFIKAVAIAITFMMLGFIFIFIFIEMLIYAALYLFKLDENNPQDNGALWMVYFVLMLLALALGATLSYIGIRKNIKIEKYMDEPDSIKLKDPKKMRILKYTSNALIIIGLPLFFIGLGIAIWQGYKETSNVFLYINLIIFPSVLMATFGVMLERFIIDAHERYLNENNIVDTKLYKIKEEKTTNKDIRKCPYCNHEIKKEDTYCIYCDHELDE